MAKRKKCKRCQTNDSEIKEYCKECYKDSLRVIIQNKQRLITVIDDKITILEIAFKQIKKNIRLYKFKYEKILKKEAEEQNNG